MKIAGIRAALLSALFKQPYYWPGRCDLGITTVLVEAVTDKGIAGIGELAGGLGFELNCDAVERAAECYRQT